MAKKVIVYGIKNCDTVKKALGHLDKTKFEYEFYDYKKTPPTKESIVKWKEVIGELPVNKKGTTYKKFLSEFEALKSEREKIQFMIENSSMITRPIIEDVKTGSVLSVGKDFEKLK